MAEISNWTDLLTEISTKKGVFEKLFLKINQTLRSYEKSNSNFNPSIVQKNHQEIFFMYKLTYEQLLIENDMTDLFVEIPSLNSNNMNIVFNMVGIGKWIKLHCGNPSRIFFFDEEKTTLSDKSLADFLNKLEIIRPQYKYFGKEPTIYYKFKALPCDDVVAYLKKYNIVATELSKNTTTVDYPRNPGNKVLLDQSMVLTLCSNLSYGLSTSFYETSDDKTLEMMVNNKQELDKYLQDKSIIISKYIFDQTKFKFDNMGGPLEKHRFEELCKRIIIVPDEKNLRFHYLKDIEFICASVAERENAIIVTGNQRFCNKISTYYSEIFYELFIGSQLAETKYS